MSHYLTPQIGRLVSEWTIRREFHRLGYTRKLPRYVLSPDPDWEKTRRIHRRIKLLRTKCLCQRHVVLVDDEADPLLFPPLQGSDTLAFVARGDALRACPWLFYSAPSAPGILQQRLHVFSGPAQDGAIAAFDNRALNQIRMLDHQSDEFIIGEFALA